MESEEKKDIRLEKSEENLREMWDTTKWTNIWFWQSQKEKRERGKKNIWRNSDQKLPKFDKIMNVNIQEVLTNLK